MTQLKIRTEYSFGKTYAPLKKLISFFKEKGITIAGIVDDNTWGHVPFYLACVDAGIKPLLGVELVVADENEPALKMWFLAKNNDGLAELYKFTSKAHRQKIKNKRGSFPRLYKLDVERMSDNVYVFAGNVVDADFLKRVNAILDISPESFILSAKKNEIAKQHNLKIVNVSDNYYCKKEDRKYFEIITKGQLKATEQHIIDIELTETMCNIAQQCSVTLPVSTMPKAEGDLEVLCREGIKFRQLEWNDIYEQRLQHELKIIKEKGFGSYFIIVADMVTYAKKHMLVGVARGSAAGSLVCYLTRITEVDPIPYNLYFERFIDISRKDYPDIDIDFPDTKRHIVTDYMREKYGHTAFLGAISRYKPRNALTYTVKAYDIPLKETNAVKSALFKRAVTDERASDCLRDTLLNTNAGKSFIKKYPHAIDAAEFEGHISHSTQHAAGLLVSGDDITNYATVDDKGIAHIDKYAAEKLGLLKIDILGLRTLTILEDCNIDVDWYKLPFDDAKALQIFNSGKLCGIFQFEGGAMRNVAKQIEFKGLKEIDAVTALARPGTLAAQVDQKYISRSKGIGYKVLHPSVEQIMSDTYGLPIYQEQTLAIVREIGGFDWADTTAVRKAMSKSLGAKYLEQFLEKFKIGAQKKGLTEKEAEEIWSLISTMGAWQMNKSHTHSYAIISYWTAWAKANYTLEFAAAALRNSKDEEGAINLLRELVNEGIEYIAFDANLSQMNWSVKDGKLVGGFLNLHGVGDVKAQKLIEQRDTIGLTENQIKDLEKFKNPFIELFPIQNKFADLYANPRKNLILGEVSKISDFENIKSDSTKTFIAEVLEKEEGDGDINLKLKDDTGTIGARMKSWQITNIGKDLINKIKINDFLLVKAKFLKDIRFAFITKIKILDVNGD